MTFRLDGNSWVRNSQWQLLSSPISSPGRLASAKHTQELWMVWTLPRLLESLQRKRVIALKVQKLSYKVSQRLYGLIKRKLGPELKDSAGVHAKLLEKLFENLVGKVSSLHAFCLWFLTVLNSFITPTIFSVSIILQLYFRRVKNLLKNNSKEKGGVSVACFHTLVNTMLINS